MFEHHLILRRLVRALRLEREWTQEELAERAGVDCKYCQFFEIARRPLPTLKFVENLARVLGVKSWILLCDEIDLIEQRTSIRIETKPEKRKLGRLRENAKKQIGEISPKKGSEKGG